MNITVNHFITGLILICFSLSSSADGPPKCTDLSTLAIGDKCYMGTAFICKGSKSSCNTKSTGIVGLKYDGPCSKKTPNCGGCTFGKKVLCKMEDYTNQLLKASKNSHSVYLDDNIIAALTYTRDNALDPATKKKGTDVLGVLGVISDSNRSYNLMLPDYSDTQWWDKIEPSPAGNSAWNTIAKVGKAVFTFAGSVTSMIPEGGPVISGITKVIALLIPSGSNSVTKEELQQIASTLEAQINQDIETEAMQTLFRDNTQSASNGIQQLTTTFQNKSVPELKGEEFFDAYCGTTNCYGTTEDSVLGSVRSALTNLETTQNPKGLPTQYYAVPPTFSVLAAPYWVYNANAYLVFNTLALYALATPDHCTGESCTVTPAMLLDLYESLEPTNSRIFDNLIGEGDHLVTQGRMLQQKVQDSLAKRFFMMELKQEPKGAFTVKDTGLKKDTEKAGIKGLSTTIDTNNIIAFTPDGNKEISIPEKNNMSMAFDKIGGTFLDTRTQFPISDEKRKGHWPYSYHTTTARELSLSNGRPWLIYAAKRYIDAWNYDVILDLNGNKMEATLDSWTSMLRFLCNKVVMKAKNPGSNQSTCQSYL